MKQTIESGHGPHIGKEAQLLAHGQQSLFRTYGRRGVVVVPRMPYGGEENCVGTHTHIVGGLGIGVADDIDGMGTTDSLLVFKLMAETLGNGIHHGHALRHYLRAYAVARKYCNLQFHANLPPI